MDDVKTEPLLKYWGFEVLCQRNHWKVIQMQQIIRIVITILLKKLNFPFKKCQACLAVLKRAERHIL